MKNITISVDDGFALKLRAASAQANKSLSHFLAEMLEQTLFPVPVAALVSRRVGVAKNKFVLPDSIDVANPKIAALLNAADKPAP